MSRAGLEARENPDRLPHRQAGPGEHGPALCWWPQGPCPGQATIQGENWWYVYKGARKASAGKTSLTVASLERAGSRTAVQGEKMRSCWSPVLGNEEELLLKSGMGWCQCPRARAAVSSHPLGQKVLGCRHGGLLVAFWHHLVATPCITTESGKRGLHPFAG